MVQLQDIVEQENHANVVSVTFTVLLVLFSLFMDAKTALSYRKATRELVGVSRKTDLQLLSEAFDITLEIRP